MIRIATRDGIAYAVRDAGRGRLTVLLHGFAGSSRTWDAVLEGLGADRRVVAIDLLGHGASDAPPATRHDVDRQATDLAWLVAGVGDGPADVVGYSFGARVALWLAVRSPGLVDRLVLESPSAGIAEAGAQADRVAADERWAALLDAGDLAVFHEAWEAQPIFASRASLPVDVRAAVRDEHLSANARGLAASLRGAGQGVMPPLHDHLGEVRAPALVLVGALDPVGRDRAAEVTARLPDARLEVIDDAGHAPHLERPESFVRTTIDFLTSSRGEP